MAPHFSAAEQQLMVTLARQKKTPVQIHTRIHARRCRNKAPATTIAEVGPDWTTVRRFLHGLSHRRSAGACGALMGEMQLLWGPFL